MRPTFMAGFVLSMLGFAQVAVAALDPLQVQKVLDEAWAKYKDLEEGANAGDNPLLAGVDSKIYGIALVTAGGEVYTAGDVRSQVSIQSISAVFTMAKVIEEQGPDAVAASIGVDATGQGVHSIVSVEQSGGSQMNPLVDPGAITATSMVSGKTRDDVWISLLGYYSDFAGRPLSVDKEVYKSEVETGRRNQAIGRLMYAYGRLEDNPDQATDIYAEQCSVVVDAKDLAVMAATLAAGGTNPLTHKAVLDARYVPKVLAVMATAGLYDDSGKWLYRTGLPAKSGAGGGFIAVSPDKFGIAVVSPPLDKAGNSVRAQKAVADISEALGGNPYAVAR